MKKITECTFCDGDAKIHSEQTEVAYKKEMFCVNQYFYKCELCGEEFTTDEVDDISMLQVYNQYRAKHQIPFVDEIVKTKVKYGLSASKMNEILGFGANSYSNFENGDLPSLAMANLLRLSEKPTVFKDMVTTKRESFSDRSYSELIKKIDLLIEEETKNAIKIDWINQPCSLNGFRKPDIDRIANLLCYYLSSCERSFNDKLKLNKMFFYTDFCSYQCNGYSVTGLSYRAIKHGPAPGNYDVLFTYLENENYIETDWEKSDNRGGIQIFLPTDGFDLSVFSEQEVEIINQILAKFKDTPSWDLRNISHDEIGWRECFPNREIIDYQKYAHTLSI
jgi:putative zinc finger/helix-turn-helix YgiT family protein